MANQGFSEYVNFTPLKNELKLDWSITYLTKVEDDGSLSTYVPSLQIYFSASDRDNQAKKIDAIIHMHFDHYMLHTKQGLKRLVLDLHKLGFKARDNADTIHKLINSKPVPAKFRIKQPREYPHEFNDEPQNTINSEMAVQI